MTKSKKATSNIYIYIYICVYMCIYIYVCVCVCVPKQLKELNIHMTVSMETNYPYYKIRNNVSIDMKKPSD